MRSDDIKVSKGLRVPVVALPDAEHMPSNGEEKQEDAWAFLCGGYTG